MIKKHYSNLIDLSEANIDSIEKMEGGGKMSFKNI